MSNFEDEIIFTISNASSREFPENSLTSWTNILPEKLRFLSRENWHIALESIGFSTEYLNFELPRNVHTPSIIITFKLSNFKKPKVRTIYFPDTRYSDEIFSKTLQEINLNYRDFIKFNYEDNKITAEEGTSEYDHVEYAFYFHETMIRNFNWEVTTDKKTISNRKLGFIRENFYKINISEKDEGGYPKHYLPKKLNFLGKNPKMVKVLCDNIVSVIENNGFSKNIATFIPSKYDQKHPYLITHFKNKNYSPISTSLLSNIKIKIVDENNKELSLAPGRSPK